MFYLFIQVGIVVSVPLSLSNITLKEKIIYPNSFPKYLNNCMVVTLEDVPIPNALSAILAQQLINQPKPHTVSEYKFMFPDRKVELPLVTVGVFVVINVN